MTLFVRLLRLGRIYKPKYDIIVYKNYTPVGRIGVLHPFKDLKVSKSRVKVLRLSIDIIRFWQARGLVLPYWLSILIEPLFISQKYHGVKINHHQRKAHQLLAKSGGVMSMKPFNFINGKAHGRFTLNSQKKNII